MRIIGGRYRSCLLRAPRGQATRPTSDRVREALFGILEAARVVEGSRVLDLYAGTGALGLEALSRGAVAATLVESSAPALAVLRANIASLGVEDRTRVVPLDVHRASRRILSSGGPFDLVIADPPWPLVDTGQAERVLSSLALHGALHPEAWVVLEHSARTHPPEANPLVRTETRAYGDTALTFYKPAILAPRAVADARLPSD
jgi:16S rRNA (guanine966-N2)-methyltransferase